MNINAMREACPECTFNGLIKFIRDILIMDRRCTMELAMILKLSSKCRYDPKQTYLKFSKVWKSQKFKKGGK